MLTFEKEYFVQSEKSNYKDYRKKKWSKLAEDLVRLLRLRREASILDFGCATGGLVRELRDRGFRKIKGTDISYWAIEYGHRIFELHEELDFYNLNLLTEEFDIIFFLDVLEHVPAEEEIRSFLRLSRALRVVVRVPVSVREGKSYVLDVSRNDVTHVQCHTKNWWMNLFRECGYRFGAFLQGKAIYDSEGVFAAVFRKCR